MDTVENSQVRGLSLPTLKIGPHSPRVPLIQGGMGVRISASRLAGAVAAAGGVGTIATVGLGQSSDYYDGTNLFESNVKALADELRLARERAPDGIISANCMVALTDYDDLVRTAAENGVDVVASGAGLPLKLPELTRDHPRVALVPIVSSLKAARVIVKSWGKRHKRLPDAIIVEEPATAGGHLGAKLEDIEAPELRLERVVPEVVEYLRSGVKADVPVIAAGGIWDGADIARAFGLGARGVQMATRFVCTHECDAPAAFKEAYIEAGKDDVAVTMSPAGLPGRVIRNAFLRAVEDGSRPPDKCFANCLFHCSYQTERQPFCIAAALVNAQRGDVADGLLFCGSNVHRSREIVHVRDLIDGLFPAGVGKASGNGPA
ncbi:MAG: NAD(P)H-dependent flavin oxidoreductase [Planctomycetota bacterium]|jgi:nitronate monooxygenase